MSLNFPFTTIEISPFGLSYFSLVPFFSLLKASHHEQHKTLLSSKNILLCLFVLVMGCFLACFGFSNKRNRRKSVHKRHGSYEPIDSCISIVSLGTAESPNTSSVDVEARSKPKDQLISKIRKKVSFNLNVQTYEPISTDYHLLKDEESDAKFSDKESEEIALGSSNLNYRYQNCRDFYDEEDDIAFEDSDLDDEDDNDEIIDDIGDSDIEGQRESQDGFLKSASSSVEEKSDVDRSECIHSVLKPVENLTQWRAAKVKAKEAAGAAKQQDQRKENVSLSRESELPFMAPQCCNQSKPLLQEIEVDSSLSTWLNSPSS